MKNLTSTLLITAFITGCSSAPKKPATPEIRGNVEYTVSGVYWTRHAAEARALKYQAYHSARLAFEKDLKTKSKKPRAIVLDIDETVLDNSPFQVGAIETGKTHPVGWAEWVQKADAEAIPGALEFLKYASGKGAKIFYVTNRSKGEELATVQNLKKLGFPDAENVQGKSDVSSKEPRRLAISEKFHISVLVGDNLNDFSDAFEKKPVADRKKIVDEMKSQWGNKFIVIPNAMYGDYEAAIYEYNYKRSDDEKFKMRHEALK